MKTMKTFYLFIIFIVLSVKINGQQFNPIVYTKPLPSNITVVNQPNDFKFTTHLVNIKIPSDSANIWNEEMERRYIKRLFNYIKDVDFIILNYFEFYFDESLGLGSLARTVSHHFNTQNKVKNIGLSLFNSSNLYNSKNLLGITRFASSSCGLFPQIVTHELYHQWNSYLAAANYWLMDPSHHTGLIEDSNTVFYGQGNNWDFQHVSDSIYSYNQGFCTGFPGKLEGYLAGLWDMPDNLRTLKNYYHYSNLPSSWVSDGFDSWLNVQVKADSIVDLNKTQLFNLYGGERIPNYLNANNNYDCAVVVFSLNDFLNDDKLKEFHYLSILNEFEGSSVEYNNLYDQILYSYTAYMNIDYGHRATNPYHSSFKKLHFKTRLFNVDGTPTIALPSKPHLVFPNTNQKNQPNDITLKWNLVEDSQKYFIQLSIDQLFGTVAYNDSTTIDTLKVITGLKEGQKYYWRIQAKNIAGSSSWSDIWNFTTHLASPTNLTLKRTTLKEITLTWNDNSLNENGYLIERKQNSQSSFKLLDTLKVSGNKYVDNKVEQGLTYLYRVKAFTEYAESDYSNEASITLVGVNEINSTPSEYSISQNYPNPFNPTTKLRFGLPERSLTKLSVYDAIGREIITLLDKEMEAGYHEIIFNASSLPSGVYYYRIQADLFSQTKKIILLK